MFRRRLKLKLVELGHDIGEDAGLVASGKLLDRGFHLRQEDELLVESIMTRDQANEDINPFDPYLESAVLGPRRSVTGISAPSTLDELDTKLMDLALDHDWNDCNSMMDTSTLGSQTTRKCIPEVAHTVKRLGACRVDECVHSGYGHNRGGAVTLSVISEDVEYQATEFGATSSKGDVYAACSDTPASVDCIPVRRRWRRQNGRDYLTEMREEHALSRLYGNLFWLNGVVHGAAFHGNYHTHVVKCSCRSDRIDRELRSLREMELVKPSPHAVQEIVQQCLKQRQVYDERVQSGAVVCEWLRTPVQVRGGQSTIQGAVSLAGPATESMGGSTVDSQTQ